jgi:hypothetical protein
LKATRQGHFQVEARVEGRFVDGLGPARRGAVEESARRFVSVTAQALRIRQRLLFEQ